jgi:hypothetical protein
MAAGKGVIGAQLARPRPNRYSFSVTSSSWLVRTIGRQEFFRRQIG